MQISKRVLVKNTAVYDSLLRERGQEVAMPLIESQLMGTWLLAGAARGWAG